MNNKNISSIWDSTLRLQKAYEKLIKIDTVPKKGKGVFVMKKFPPTTLKHDTTSMSFEENEKHLKEFVDNDPIWDLHFLDQKETLDAGPRLIKKLQKK